MAVIHWCANCLSDHYDRVMAGRTVVPSRSSYRVLPPSGRCRRTLTGTPECDRNSVSGGQRQHLSTLALGQSAPDPVRLVHLQCMGAARGHRRALEADGLRLRLAACPGRSALALGVEEVRTGHSAARRMQLPVPQIGVRAWQASGVSHVDPLASDQCPDESSQGESRTEQRSRGRVCCDPETGGPTVPGIGARWASRLLPPGAARGPRTAVAPGDSPFGSRIRADPGVVDLQTVERLGPPDKTLIMKFVDLDDGLGTAPPRGGSAVAPGRRCGTGHVLAQRRRGTRRCLKVSGRLLSAVIVPSSDDLSAVGPRWGSFRCRAGAQGFDGPASVAVQVPSTPSAGGVT